MDRPPLITPATMKQSKHTGENDPETGSYPGGGDVSGSHASAGARENVTGEQTTLAEFAGDDVDNSEVGEYVEHFVAVQERQTALLERVVDTVDSVQAAARDDRDPHTVDDELPDHVGREVW